MKKINLIEMLQGCSKRNGTTFRQSNPDGQTTVNRQSRLMSRQGYLRNLAMIFAVLVLSIANIGMAWGANYYVIPAKCNVSAGALVAGADGSTQLFKTNESTVTVNTDISTSITTTASLYYNSTSTTYANLTKTSNYGTSQGSSRTMIGIKLSTSTNCTITVNKKTFTKLDVIYRCASKDEKTLVIDGENCTTSDQNVHLKSITKNYTSNIVISNSSDKEYQIFIILTEGAVATHTVTAATEDEDKGTASAGSATVLEGATTTITATPKSGYKFDHWTVSGTGATLSSTTTNPTTLTMGTANATVTAYFAEVSCPSSGTVYSLSGWSGVSNTSSWSGKDQIDVEIAGLTISGGSAHAVSIESSKKCGTTGSGASMEYTLGYNSVALRCVLDCSLAVGDVITIESNGSHSNAYILTNTNSRSSSVTSTTTAGTTKSYTVTSSDILKGKSDIYIWRSSSSVNIKTINISRSAATCTDKYSFHYGPATGDWETPICFEKVGSTHEWNITNFAIPDHTNGQFWVGHHGETNSQSQTKAWTDSYSDGNGAMKLLPVGSSIVGQATGAIGTINIWDDSGWKNQNVGFTPNGYGITYGGSGHAFHTTATAHMLETDVVTLPDVSTAYTMGLATATSGTYVTCAHSKAAEAISAMGVTIVNGGKKAIYLVPGSFDDAGAVYAVWDGTNSKWGDGTTKLLTDANGDGIWEGVVASNCSSINLVRLSSGTTASNIDWGRKWNQTSDISISGDLAKKYTITSLSGDNCSYSTANMQPITGQKGKFRMWDDSGSSNWYVHWIPYYVLSYDANGGSETTAATERSSESGTITVTVAANGFTAPAGYTFAGWATNEARADEGTVDYAVGADYSLTSDATLYAVWNCITPDAPTASAITATDGCGAAATFSVEIPSLPSYVTWYWQTSSGGTSTSNPASTDYTTDATAGSKTIYLRAKNTVCGSWSDAVSKSATVRTAVTATWSTAPADGTVGGSMTASVTTNYSAGLRFSSSDATVASVNETSGAISYLKAGTTTITATVTGAGSYCGTASVNKSITVSAAAALNDGCWDPANTAADKLKSGDVTLTAFDNNFSGVTGITSVTLSKGTSDGKCSGADETPTSSGYLKVKNATTNKIITIVTTAAKDITIGGEPYGSNTGSFYLVKSTAESTKLAECNTGATSKATNCPAGTYYVYAKASTKSINFSLLCIEDAAPDVTAPTFVSSVPANGATGVATSGTIVLTFSEALGSVDASKFTLTGASKGAVAIDGSDATKVNIPYSGAANSATVTLATDAAAVSDLAGNALAAALTNISFTTAAAAPAGDCITIAYFETTSHSNSSSKPDNAGKYIYGYTNSAKTEAYAYTITSSTGDNKGQGTGESDYLRMNYGTTVTIYADNTTTGGTPASFSNVTSVSVDFKMKNSSYYTTFDIYVGGTKIADNVSLQGAAQSAFTTFTYEGLAQLNGKISIINKGSGSSNYHFYVDNIQICTSSLPACTTPELPTLTAKTVCEGGDAAAAWDATITNSGSLVAGETVAYSWVKKGGSTPVSSVATYQPTDVTEAMAGTYVVTATVSADGKASKSASQEVDLAVTEGTEAPTVTQSTTPVYEGNSVTLTATATTGATYTWHTCNADGTGESSAISGATTNAYTIASAPAAGTHYYKVKVTGDGTHTCGNAETVYALTVSEAAGGDCETEFWFAKAADKPEGATAATHISGTPSGSSSASYTATIDGNNYTITGQTGQKTGNVTITVPEDYEGTLYVVVQGSSSRTITLSKGGVQVGQETPANSTWGTFTFSNLDAGTYTLVSSGNIGWGILALKLCSAVACTDPEVTASADNTTACVETSVTFTATGAHASATYQWQKLDGTWTNISDETAPTYTIASVVAGDAGKYRVIASHDCNRTSNEVTLSVPTLPDFGSTVPASVSVMQTIALSINTVEATDAVKYRWYKSADPTWDAGDTEIGTNKELIKAYDSEAIGSPSYYIFCRAQNSCGITTSSAIAVNVTAYVEEDCATRGNESDAEFGFEYSAGQGDYGGAKCWTMSSNSKILVYSAPDGKYFKTAKVTIASSSESKASYNWSTNGGTSYTAVSLKVNSTLTERTIDLSAHGNVNAFQIGRNFDSKGSSGGTLYVSKICFEYTDACTATTVTPDESSKTYEMGSGSFTEPTFTVKYGETAFAPQPTLSYSSSNEDIASVDDDGTVTFNGEAGTVTITAAYAGNATYCASEGSYTITVTCPGGAPKVVQSGTTVGCSSSITLHAKKQDGTAFADGTYQWFRNGTEIDGETSSSYTARQAGTYTVARTNTSDCTTPSTNSAVVTSTATEPEVERLVPFQYYHVDKDYTDQMKMRHLFAVKNSGTLDGKHFKMYVSRNGGVATDVTSSNALVVKSNGDGHVDTVKVDLNKLSGKYSENDELVFTCKAIDCTPAVSDVYKNTITMRVIGATPTLALICSGSSKAEGTRKTSELTVGGDFLTGYNVADLCQQTGNTSFDANTEWGLYTELKAHYIVTPVNGYAVFNKLNYEPFDILLLTDYPKASKSDAAATVLDDMADLCDYRPMLSFKAHMVAKSPSKWAAKGFTTSATENKADGKLNLNIVCYAHPMFESIKTGENVYDDVANSSAPLVYTMLTGEGYEGKKGMQGFELAAAENFVTIGLTHYNATITKNSPNAGEVSWTPGTEDRMLVTVAERQTNIEARFILFSLNCGAQSMLTEKGRTVILKCLEYLLETDPLKVADCSFTFDNGDGNKRTPEQQAINCSSCPPAGDGKWSNPANWGPDYRLLPGEFTSVRIKKPVEVDMEHAHVMEVRIIDEGSIDIPAGKALDVKSTIRRMDGSEIYPTEENDIHIGSASTGNGTLIFNNDEGDTKARVDMYSKGFIDEGVKNYQYMGTPFVEINALYNYYGSWIYRWGTKKNGNLGWVVVKNGGPMTAWTGYCITQEAPTTHAMSGTLTATGTVDITVPANANMVVGNSWTAPIDINALTTDDLEGLTASIYFFNTGVDKTGGGTTTENATGDARWTGGTYVSVPIHTAPYTGDDHIPSLQGFFVKSNGSAGTLHLDYDRHVRKTTRDNILSGELHAPARRTALSSDEPVVLKMKVSGENYDDKLLLLEREDFTEGFDNGWDGDKWDGNESALYIYTTDNNGTENSVSAIPELEGTIIGFRAGEDDAYTLNFEYLNSDEPLYLYDVENNTYTQIMTGMTYRFFTTDNEKHERFIITRSNGQEVATGVEPVSGSLDRSKAKKLLIEDKMFIMVNGMLYDATGKVVK